MNEKEVEHIIALNLFFYLRIIERVVKKEYVLGGEYDLCKLKAVQF